MATIAIEGLTEAQTNALSNIRIGDLISFSKIYDELQENDSQGEGDESNVDHPSKHSEDDEDSDEGLGEDESGIESEGDEEDENAAENDGRDGGADDSEDSENSVTIITGDEQPGHGLTFNEMAFDPALANHMRAYGGPYGSEEDDEDDTDQPEHGDDVDIFSKRSLYLIHAIVYGTKAAVEDIKLLELTYSSKLETKQTLQIFGTQLTVYTESSCVRTQCSGCEQSLSLCALAGASDDQSHTWAPTVNKRADDVRMAVADALCPAD